jgi:HicA toxin of bacterial toxin-antitoxin,
LAKLARELKKLLSEAGCYYIRSAKGDHEWWFSPIVQRHFAVDAGIKSHNTANAILKQAGLPKAF